MLKIIGYWSRLRNQVGATVVFIALMLTVLIGFVALAIDIGYLMVTKNELQNVADAAALGACRKLGNIYQGMTYTEQQGYVCDPAPIKLVAQELGLKNTAATKSIVINDADIEIGHWSQPSFTATLTKPNAVRVTARRDSNANGPVSTFFAGVLGIDFMEAKADATASLTGQGTAAEGEVQLPVGIDSCWFFSNCNPTGTGATCGSEIKFYPTSSCAGWTGFDEKGDTPRMKDLVNGVDENPEIIAGDGTEWYFDGGVKAAVFPDLVDLFKRKGWDIDSSGEPIRGIYDALGNERHVIPQGTGDEQPLSLYKPNPTDKSTWYRAVYDSDSAVVQEPLYWPDGQRMNNHHWSTTVVVYESNGCGNPVQTMKIVGFAKILITYIGDAPEKNIVGELECNSVSQEDSRGGGGEFGGLMGSIPGLVK